MNDETGYGFAVDELELPKVEVSASDFDPVEAGKRILNETVVFELHIHAPGFRKKIRAENFVTNATNGNGSNSSDEAQEAIEGLEFKPTADPSFIHVTQDILDRNEIKAIGKHDSRFTSWIKERAVPSPMLANGLYLLPIHLIEDVETATNNYVHKREELINTFEQKYEGLIEDARSRRGDFFEATDYPIFQMIREKYSCEYRWLSMNVPAVLQRVNDDIYRRAQEKAQMEWADCAQEMRDAARVSAQEYLAHISEQLGNDESGKPKRLHESAVNKFRDFIQVFLSGGDLTGDDALQNVLKDAKEILSGVDVKSTRKDGSLRSSLKTAVDNLATQASGLITTSRRKFNFGAQDALETAVIADASQTTSEGLELV